MYQLQITEKGEIKKPNLAFMKVFDVAVAQNSAYTFSSRFMKKAELNMLNTESVVLIKCADRKGVIRTSLFVKIKDSRQVAEYVGYDVTESFNGYSNMIKKIDVDKATGLPNLECFYREFSYIRETAEKVCLACFDINNLDVYRTLYGENVASVILSDFVTELPNKVKSIRKIYCLSKHTLLGIIAYTGTDILNIKQSITDYVKMGDYETSNYAALPDIRVGLLDIEGNNVKITPEQAVEKARITLSVSQRSKKNKVSYYRAVQSNFPTNFDDDSVLDRMISNNELELFFQPIHETDTHRLCYFEALLRIVSDKNAEISIFDFVNKVETSGGIAKLGWFVLDKSIEFAKVAEKFGKEVSVNVSPFQLMQDGYVDTFLKKIDESGIKRSSIHVEITEGALMYAFESMQRKLELLDKSGIRIHIDDFGVAYSSLVYIKRLPASIIKIDKIFIDDLGVDPKAEMMVRCIVEMVKGLGMRCIAEGVDNETQMDILNNLGCEYVQGYYFSKALSFKSAVELMKAKI